jgi:hypothetical protein
MLAPSRTGEILRGSAAGDFRSSFQCYLPGPSSLILPGRGS